MKTRLTILLLCIPCLLLLSGCQSSDIKNHCIYGDGYGKYNTASDCIRCNKRKMNYEGFYDYDDLVINGCILSQ